MSPLIITSLQPGEGKTTTAIYLLGALQRLGMVMYLLDLGNNQDATRWLKNTPSLNEVTVISDQPAYDQRRTGIAKEEPEHCQDRPVPGSRPDYSAEDWLIVDFALSNQRDDMFRDVEAYAVLVVKVGAEHIHLKALNALDQRVARLRGRGFDLIIPVQFDAREWEQNTAVFDALIDTLGETRIGNPLPYCTRIESQYIHGGIIWDLPVPHLQKPYDEAAAFIAADILLKRSLYDL